MIQYAFYLPLGLVLGTFGTLIGAGGGFLLVPLLLLLMPESPPEMITAISLAVVCVNASSGSLSYARMKRIDYRSGIVFALATIPGAVLGAITTGYIPRFWFNIVFGAVLILVATYLFVRPERVAKTDPDDVPKGHQRRCIVERNGMTHVYCFDPRVGVALSVVIGYVSSLLGIGGGIIHVPALVNLLGFPVHIATATSHFVLVFTALTGTIVHLTDGTLQQAIPQTLLLAAGVLVGAPLGAKLSGRLHGRWIIRGLAGALVLVGVRLVLLAVL